jgi:pilus assembly protein FimV
MYLVRSGQILKIPDRAATVSINPAEATRLMRAQSVEFDEYRRSLGASVAAAPAKPTPPPERAAPGRITPKPAEPAPKDAKDQIKLSKIDSAKPTAPASRAAAEDDKASLNRALKESQSRVSDLEKQVTDLTKLIDMKNQQLALLEQKAAAKPAAEAPKPVPPAPKPVAEPVKPAAEAPKPAAEAPKSAAPKPAPDAVKAKPAAAALAPPSLMDEFLENPLALAGLGAVVALLVGYGAWAWRRKKSAQEREGGFGAVAAASAASTAAQGTVASPDRAPAEAALAQAGIAPGVGDEVDPIAEADVYLAYGRDAQAETILKDALASNPDRLVVHAKLLDIYAQRRDIVSFEKTALKVKSLSGGSGAEWQKARGLGRSIDPENGLYGTRSEAEGETLTQPASASPTVDFDLGGGAASAPAPGSVDFDIGASASAAEAPAQFKPGDTVVLSASEMQAASSKMDFDIGATTQETLAAKPAPAAEATEEAPSSLDFNLDFDLGESKPAPAKPAVAPDISSISLDLGAPGQAQPGAGATSKWQEVATKLDLAKAYEEMGDKDGARELLNEVLKEGDAAQQEEAKRILAKLG